LRRIITVILSATILMAAAATLAQGGEADLLGTAWLAEDIDGRGVVDRARSTMDFTKAGQVSGLAACNRYFGPVSLSGDAITFGNLAATRMMCPDTLMDQEQRFLQALSRSKRFELTHEGQILLIYADGSEPVLRFSKIIKN
jgi:heat shock protein HslJ